jgi:lipopolysaccharide transport system ATP-binding protein
MGSLMSSEIAIRVEGLSKCYEVYELPRDRLKQFLYSGLTNILGLKPQKFFREFWALKDISFELNKGDSLGIVGKNGSGKSTLLQILCGILSSTSGSFEVVGRVVALLELGSGFNPEFSGRENIYLNASLLGLNREEIDSYLDQIIDFAEVDAHLDQPLRTYSTGMMLRLAFAVAVHSNPDILVIDEALAVGDELFQRKCFSKIESMRRLGVTLVIVSHSSSAIIEHCNKVIFLHHGNKFAFGHPKDVIGFYHKYIYSAPEESEKIKNEIVEGNFLELDPIHLSAENHEESFFDPNLVSKSQVAYGSNGATIHSFGIYKLSGEQVNILTNDRDYFYEYKVAFHQGAEKIKFGMLIKTVSGMELGGAIFTPPDPKNKINEGDFYTIRFKFSCRLNPGLFFLNAGILGSIDNQENFLHRIEDAICFRVKNSTNSCANGIVNFGVVSELIKHD